MSCYWDRNADGTIGTESKWFAKGTLTDNLKQLIQSKANKYNLDWKWLAAMAYVESAWNTNAGPNKYGYYGLFQFRGDTIDGDLYSIENQTENAAKNMARNLKTAQRKGMSNEDCYLYAGMAHNAGPGGAGFILNKAISKTIFGMQHAILTIPASQMPWSWMATDSKRKEIHDYPTKMKSAYVSIQ